MPKRRKRREQSKEPKAADFIVNRQAQCIVIQVDDPGYQRQHDGAKGNTRTTRATINMRESPVLWMYAHNNIDTAQFEAAKKFRKLYEQAQGAGVQAFDYTREPVDGGKISEPITDQRVRAAKELAGVREALGSAGYSLVETVCAHCIDISSVYTTDWARKRERKLFKICLESLVSYWGLVSRKGHFYRDQVDQRRAV